MTAVFALLAVLGAAGIGFSLLAGRAPLKAAAFRDALLEADGPEQAGERRLEELQKELSRRVPDRALPAALARKVALLEEKVRLLELAGGLASPAAVKKPRARKAAVPRPGRRSPGGEISPEGGYRPARRFSADAPRHDGPELRETGVKVAAERAAALSERMSAVWEAARDGSGPLEVARALKMGVAEVELALKVRDLRAARGL